MARVFIDGLEFPGVFHRLELVPVARLVLSQPFPPAQRSLRQLASPPGEPERVVTVEVKKDDLSPIYTASGPVSSYHVQFADMPGYTGDMEFLEVAYTDLRFAE